MTAYYKLSNKRHTLADSLDTADGTKLNWRNDGMCDRTLCQSQSRFEISQGWRVICKMCATVAQFDLDKLRQETIGKNTYFICNSWTSLKLYFLPIFVIMFLQQKIPACFVPVDMSSYGDIKLVCHPETVVKGSYMISEDDKRVSVNGWKEFMNKNPNLEIGDKMLFLLYLG